LSNKKTTPGRLAAFSDGVFSVIITIMVLDLKPPAEAMLKALLAVAHCLELRRQLFVCRDYLGEPSSPFEICSRGNISAYLVELRPSFMVSLVPATTVAFERAALSQASDSEITPRLRRITRIRSYLALGMFSAATAVSYWSPLSGLALVCCVLLIYLSPRVPKSLHKRVR
jgi:Endosomal/lysosomal potassium channel TMEM175